MSNRLFEHFRKTELKSRFTDFNFSEILRTASNNQFWQDKEALWTVISRCM